MYKMVKVWGPGYVEIPDYPSFFRTWYNEDIMAYVVVYKND